LIICSIPFTNTLILPVALSGPNSNSIVTFSPTVMFVISLIANCEGSLDTSKLPEPLYSITFVPFTSIYIASTVYSPASKSSRTNIAEVPFNN